MEAEEVDGGFGGWGDSTETCWPSWEMFVARVWRASIIYWSIWSCLPMRAP